MILSIELLSDTCIASGESVAGVIDTDIEFDDMGIPYIPAKRIKGILREAAEDLSQFENEKCKKCINSLFGQPGTNIGSKLIIENGYVEGYDSLKEDIKSILTNREFSFLLNKEIIKKFFTYTRTQTAVEEGVSKENSLRISRVIKKGFKFKFNVYFSRPIQDNERNLLKNCCKIVRHIGLNRTRGYGYVKCKIEGNRNEYTQEQESENIKNEIKDYVDFTISLRCPCILNKDYISGGEILGAFASKYLILKNIKSKNAHLNEEFRRLFLSSSTKFLNCYVLIDDEMYIPAPLSIVREKNADDNICYDLACCPKDNVKGKKLIKFLKSYVKIDGDEIETTSIDRSYFYHHRRPEDKTIGHALGNTANNEPSETDIEKNGAFFQYDAIKEGTIFKGRILGDKRDLNTLINLFKDDNRINIGTSKNVQYGAADIKFSVDEKRDYEYEEFDDEDQVVLTLESPTILLNNMGYNTTDCRFLLDEVFGENNYEIIKSFIKIGDAGGYNAKWGMPKEQVKTISEGSVIVVKTKRTDFNEIVDKSYGYRTNEGYGRIRLNYHGANDELLMNECSTEEKVKTIVSLNDIKNEQSKELINYAIKEKINSIVLYNYEESDYSRKIIRFLSGSKNSVIANITAMFEISNNFKSFMGQLNEACERLSDNEENKYKEFKRLILNRKSNNDNHDIKYIFEKFITDIIFESDKYKKLQQNEISSLILDDENSLFELFKFYYVNLLNSVKLKNRGEA